MQQVLRRSFLLSALSVLCLLTVASQRFGNRTLQQVQASSDNHEAGAGLFHERGCEHCHGVDGIGIAQKGPALTTVGKRLTKEAIARQIREGGNGMPAFGESLQPDEIEQLVSFLAAKKKAPKDARKVSAQAFISTAGGTLIAAAK